MSNTQIFLYPGEIALNFILSLFGSYAGTMDAGLYVVIASMLALVIWVWALKLCFVLLQRALGFGNKRGHG
ncbi:Uncharacterised protein [Halioglobus japonicus]|nr:Uncharacterised protein [Halioglobus japonicus]